MERFVQAFYNQGGDAAEWYSLGARSYDGSFGTWTVTDTLNNLNEAKEQAFRVLRGKNPVV